MLKNSLFQRLIVCVVCLSFFVQSVGLAWAQAASSVSTVSFPTDSVLLQGLKIIPDDAFQLSFFLNIPESAKGDLSKESARLVDYFLAALAMPEDDLWVNLSPAEPGRIIPDALAVTELGRDMLVQDYKLKTITAQFLNPDHLVGRHFWEEVQRNIYARFGRTDLPQDLLSKVWIVPDQAEVFFKNNTVWIVKTHLKVMTDQDHSVGASSLDPASHETQNLIKEIVIPALEREVNESQDFALLRQMYHSVILASWYKTHLKKSILNQAYTDKKHVAGIDSVSAKEKEVIYGDYLKVFQAASAGFIKEEYDPSVQDIVSRKYIVGGIVGAVKGRLANASQGIDFPSMNLGRLDVRLDAAMMAQKKDRDVVLRERRSRKNAARRDQRFVERKNRLVALDQKEGPLTAGEVRGLLETVRKVGLAFRHKAIDILVSHEFPKEFNLHVVNAMKRILDEEPDSLISLSAINLLIHIGTTTDDERIFNLARSVLIENRNHNDILIAGPIRQFIENNKDFENPEFQYVYHLRKAYHIDDERFKERLFDYRKEKTIEIFKELVIQKPEENRRNLLKNAEEIVQKRHVYLKRQGQKTIIMIAKKDFQSWVDAGFVIPINPTQSQYAPLNLKKTFSEVVERREDLLAVFSQLTGLKTPLEISQLTDTDVFIWKGYLPAPGLISDFVKQVAAKIPFDANITPKKIGRFKDVLKRFLFSIPSPVMQPSEWKSVNSWSKDYTGDAGEIYQKLLARMEQWIQGRYQELVSASKGADESRKRALLAEAEWEFYQRYGGMFRTDAKWFNFLWSAEFLELLKNEGLLRLRSSFAPEPAKDELSFYYLRKSVYLGEGRSGDVEPIVLRYQQEQLPRDLSEDVGLRRNRQGMETMHVSMRLLYEMERKGLLQRKDFPYKTHTAESIGKDTVGFNKTFRNDLELIRTSLLQKYTKYIQKKRKNWSQEDADYVAKRLLGSSFMYQVGTKTFLSDSALAVIVPRLQALIPDGGRSYMRTTEKYAEAIDEIVDFLLKILSKRALPKFVSETFLTGEFKDRKFRGFPKKEPRYAAKFKHVQDDNAMLSDDVGGIDFQLEGIDEALSGDDIVFSSPVNISETLSLSPVILNYHLLTPAEKSGL